LAVACLSSCGKGNGASAFLPNHHLCRLHAINHRDNGRSSSGSLRSHSIQSSHSSHDDHDKHKQRNHRGSRRRSNNSSSQDDDRPHQRKNQRSRELQPAMSGSTTSRPNKHQFTKKLMMPQLKPFPEFRSDARQRAAFTSINPNPHNDLGDLFVRPYTPPSASTTTITAGRELTPETGASIPVVYTNEARTLIDWLGDNLPSGDYHTPALLGFDTESVHDPSVFQNTRFQGPATIQLATTKSSIVLQLVDSIDSRRNRRPSQSCASIIHTLLADPTIIKAGVELDRDIVELYQAWNRGTSHPYFSHAKSRLNLENHIQLPNWTQKPGLKTLCRHVVGVELLKSPQKKNQWISYSNWSQVPLMKSQLYYAGRDAWAGAAICEALLGAQDGGSGSQDVASIAEHLRETEQSLQAMVAF